MGNQKQKWTADEEDALHRGVQKHGAGKWKNILKDPEFAPFLTSRSNIDLKDKWRNLSVGNGQGSKDKSRTPKIKAIVPVPVPVPAPAPTPAPVAAPQNAAPAPQTQTDHPSQSPPRYNAMIFEALSSIKDTNGSDINAIVSFIEQKHKVPHNFRRALGTRLRRLVSQGKLEKVQNCYKIKKDTPTGTKLTAPKSPAPKQEDVWPRQSPASSLLTSIETIKDAADTAAYRVADAENKSFLAAEAVKEVERISRLAEDTDSMLQLVKEIYEKCSRGEIVLLA
ncbi:telomere repeat-binding factor 4-like [Gastrolobium bilobum]|uniref:telomere repeat-binding factor 4-like n=1 Tax=Gastrolobium bilobum TaxID=150636 RepID=UPI002AB2351C|nr:telomere repeat-binding factor 4-like [Gastrolobium bilobum]